MQSVVWSICTLKQLVCVYLDSTFYICSFQDICHQKRKLLSKYTLLSSVKVSFSSTGHMITELSVTNICKPFNTVHSSQTMCSEIIYHLEFLIVSSRILLDISCNHVIRSILPIAHILFQKLWNRSNTCY